MTIKQVAVRRIFNLGNYETIHVELQAIIEEGENVQEVIDKLHKETRKYRDYIET